MAPLIATESRNEWVNGHNKQAMQLVGTCPRYLGYQQLAILPQLTAMIESVHPSLFQMLLPNQTLFMVLLAQLMVQVNFNQCATYKCIPHKVVMETKTPMFFI